MLFGLDVFDMALGFVAAMVVIQFFPKVGNVGTWIVTQIKRIRK